MKRNTALSAAAALTLTMAGGVSALALTMQQESTQPAPTIVTEYVDQFGNTVAAPEALSALAPVPVAQPTVIVVDESEASLGTVTPSQPAASASVGAASDDEAQEDDEHPEHDERQEDDGQQEGGTDDD